MLIINLKTYPEVTGSQIEAVTAVMDEFLETNPGIKEKLFLAPPTLDLGKVMFYHKDINLVAQHVDAVESGKSTGMVTPAGLMDLGVGISMLNHSEHRIDPLKLSEEVSFLVAKGMKVIVCCENMQEAEILVDLKPFAIAYEPKELIGSGISVSTQEPEVVEQFVKLIKERGQGNIKAIIGAGISTGEDVRKGLELGAEGFLLASAFVSAEDKLAKLKEFTDPWTQA
jgi:triosephosphate isomerase (TIM)